MPFEMRKSHAHCKGACLSNILWHDAKFTSRWWQVECEKMWFSINNNLFIYDPVFQRSFLHSICIHLNVSNGTWEKKTAAQRAISINVAITSICCSYNSNLDFFDFIVFDCNRATNEDTHLQFRWNDSRWFYHVSHFKSPHLFELNLR